MPTEGKLSYFNREEKPVEVYYPLISIAAPYLETIEEMTANEFLRFHGEFKPLLPAFSVQQVLERVGLRDAADKQIRFYSSGMKQRIKLAQAFFSDTPVVLLDEPTTNLDALGIGLYHDLINEYCSERLIIVSSNDPMEYSFCTTIIDMKELKK